MAHAGNLLERTLDLAQLDAKTVELHERVEAALDVQQAILVNKAQVTSAIAASLGAICK